MRVVDLFAGVGGLSLGFKCAGWKIAAAFDNDPMAVGIYRRLVGAEARVADVRHLMADDLPDAEAIIGGVPCQPYSVAGKRRGSRDPRDGLSEFLRLVLAKRPQLVLVENVPALVSMPEFDTLLGRLAGAGYAVGWRILNAADYGVPQTRRRLFVIALRGKCLSMTAWPMPTHSRYPGLFTEQWLSAASVLLPHLQRREPDLDRLPRWIERRWHQVPFSLQNEVLIHPQLSGRDGQRDYLNVRPLRLPAFTVTASSSGTRYAHVVHAQRYWRVRPQEMAALQGLPYLPEMKAVHIGNAVPPLLGQQLAEALLRVM